MNILIGVKESLQEQSKVKFALERKILKLQREYETCSNSLKSSQNSLDSNDDMAIRLQHVLNPPSVEVKLKSLSIESHMDRNTSILSSPPVRKSITLSSYNLNSDNYKQEYGFIPFEINSSIVENLRNFRDGCRQDLKIRKANQAIKKFHEESDDSSNEDGKHSSDEDDSNNLSHSISNHPLDAVCLAAFGVLMKHISGTDKFLIGVNLSLRKDGILPGPLTDTVPAKIDFGGKGVCFNSLLDNLTKSLHNSKKIVAESPFSSAARVLNLPNNFPVLFEFINYNETKKWKNSGLTSKDILAMETSSIKVIHEDMEVRVDRLWSRADYQSHDIKLVLVEEAEEIVGGIYYNKNVYDEEKVSKWVSKYITTLEGIEFGARKVVISNLISR